MGLGSQPEEDRIDLSEILKEKLYFAPLMRAEDSAVVQCLPKPAACFSVDNELIYEPFFADFGPLNLACTYRFCRKLHQLLEEADEQNQCVFFCCSADPKKKSNAAVLLGAYLLLFCGVTAEEAYAPLSMFEPFLPFRDPTCGVSTYHLTVMDCIRAILKAHQIGWIDFNDFNLEEYEYFEQVENGDLNWIVPNKLMAFSGPSAKRLEIYGYRTLEPEDYVEYFHQVGVSGIVRLNRRAYDRRRFTDHGLSHYDLYFPDGSCPPERILRRFLEIVEETPGALAVHCKAGLGRTGVLIGCYIMKHCRFTCNETLGYLRIVRPGSVIGPQQRYLKDMQPRMWKAKFRAFTDMIPTPEIGWSNLLKLYRNGLQVQGDMMRHHLVNVSSRQYNPASKQMRNSLPPNVFTGGTSWSKGHNRFLSVPRKYSQSAVVRRESVRDWGDNDGARHDTPDQRSQQIKFSDPMPPQRVRRSAGGNALMIKGQQLKSEVSHLHKSQAELESVIRSMFSAAHALLWDDRSGRLRGQRSSARSFPTPARRTVTQQSAALAVRGTNLESSMGRLVINANTESSSSANTEKASCTSPVRSSRVPLRNSGILLSLSNIVRSADNPGILQSGFSLGAARKVAATRGSVMVQRMINSAGQPRKVVLPVTEAADKSVPDQVARLMREGRASVSQGTTK